MRKTFLTVSMLTVLAGCAVGAEGTGETEILGHGSAGITVGTTYKFTLPQLTGKCMDVSGAGSANGTKIQE